MLVNATAWNRRFPNKYPLLACLDQWSPSQGHLIHKSQRRRIGVNETFCSNNSSTAIPIQTLLTLECLLHLIVCMLHLMFAYVLDTVGAMTRSHMSILSVPAGMGQRSIIILGNPFLDSVYSIHLLCRNLKRGNIHSLHNFVIALACLSSTLLCFSDFRIPFLVHPSTTNLEISAHNSATVSR